MSHRAAARRHAAPRPPPLSPHPSPPVQLQALWAELLARLWLAQVASAQAAAHQQLHALGLRRSGTLSRILAREQHLVQRLAAAGGVVVTRHEVQHRIGELAQPAPLLWHLQQLALAYARISQQCGEAPAWPLTPALARTLVARQRVHQVQADALAALDRPGPP